MPGKYTTECTKKVQPAYKRQVYERYEPLVGYYRKDKRRGFKSLIRKVVPKAWMAAGGFDRGETDEEVERIFKSNERRKTKPLVDPKLGQERAGGSVATNLKEGDAGQDLGDAGANLLKAAQKAASKDQRRSDQRGHKYFFAINLYNSFDIIPDLFSTMFKVSAILGYQNCFVSVYENGSKDQTKALLRIFDALARAVGLRVVIRTSLRRRGAFNHRIEYLAEVRNAALAPLQELREADGEVFDSVIFQNDVLPCVDDVLELIWQSRRQNAGITCGADYIFHAEIGQPVFYDNWVSRDMNGTALENAPFEQIFRNPEWSHRFQRHLPIQVQSCWNGIAILDPAPLYGHPSKVKFRMANLGEGECSASECSLICNDYWEAGYGRIMMVPRVKLAYDARVWDVIHPPRKNLTIIRGYTRIGGSPDDPASDPQDRGWFGPHDRLFRPEESEQLKFEQPPPYVWCWGWDGAGDLDGPDVEPIWEALKNFSGDPTVVRHDRCESHESS